MSIAKFCNAEDVLSKIWSTLSWSSGILYVPVRFTVSSSFCSILNPPNILPSVASINLALVELNSLIRVEILNVKIIPSLSPLSA